MQSRERTNRRTAQEVASHRVKYAGAGGGPVCKICGAPTDSILLRCEACQEKLFLTEELRRTGEWLREHPETKLELATDKRKQVHIVVPRFAAMAWCGIKVTQQKERKREVRAKFPPGVCQDCLLAYEGLGL